MQIVNTPRGDDEIALQTSTHDTAMQDKKIFSTFDALRSARDESAANNVWVVCKASKPTWQPSLLPPIPAKQY